MPDINSQSPGDLVKRIEELEAQLSRASSQIAVLQRSEEALQEAHTKSKRQAKLGLVWEDQTEELEADLASKALTLKENKKRVVKSGPGETENILIEGDNLHALNALQFPHRGKVDVIYIDPPYNTGSKDFRYNDSYVDTADEWRHSKWLSFMAKRLRLAKSLLAPDGFIALSIDDNEMAHLKLLLDQLFGERNMVANVVVESGNANGPKTTHKDKTIFKVKEYLLVYRLGGSEFRLNPRYEFTEEYDTKYNLIVSSGKLFTRHEYLSQTGKSEADIIAECFAGTVDVFRPRWDFTTKTPKFQGEIEAGELTLVHDLEKYKVLKTETSGGTDLYLRHNKETGEVDQLNPLKKKIVADGKTFKILKLKGDLWKGYNKEYGSKVAAEGGVVFKNGKKSVELLKQVIGLHPNSAALVLDFFAGSGSTGHAVAALNKEDGGTRKFILVTNNEGNICTEVTYPRLKGVLTGSLPNGKRMSPLPGGLRYLKCAAVSLPKSRPTALQKTAMNSLALISLREEIYTVVESNSKNWAVLAEDDKVVISWNLWDTSELYNTIRKHNHFSEKVAYVLCEDSSLIDDLASEFPDWRFERPPGKDGA